MLAAQIAHRHAARGLPQDRREADDPPANGPKQPSGIAWHFRRSSEKLSLADAIGTSGAPSAGKAPAS
jgi:hypothetical protein